ncbi:MAG TPA: FAD-dependent monooxygenase [Micromonosporaceae bacterium]
MIVSGTEHRRSGCEVLIIGSGTSGLSTALELAHRGVADILVADHGPFAGFEHETRTSPAVRCPAPAVDWRLSARHYSTLPGTTHPVGGRSRGWHGVVLPVHRRVLAERWPYRVVATLLGDGPGSYAAVLRELDQWRAVPVGTAQCASDDRISRAWNALQPATPVSVVPQAGRSSDTGAGRRYWVYSPLLAWRQEGLHRHRGIPLPTIAHDLQAAHLLLDGDRVTGAVFRLPDGTTRTVTAEVVVLAAGALENTRLYAQALALRQEPVLTWPGLNDHLTHGIVVPLPDSLRAAWSAPDRAFLWSEQESAYRANLFVDVHAMGLPEPILDLWWIAQQEEPFTDSIGFTPDGGTWPARIDS